MDQRHYYIIEAAAVRAVIDLQVCHVRSLKIEQADWTIETLPTAPWVDNMSVVANQAIDKCIRFLSGNFLCARFCQNDLENALSHLWPSNAACVPIEASNNDSHQIIASFELERSVIGAKLAKEVSLYENHPFLYGQHMFFDEEEFLPVANHSLTRFDPVGNLSCSAKILAETPEIAMESDPTRWYSKPPYPVKFADPSRGTLAKGSFADWTYYSFTSSHGNFAYLIEDPKNQLGWAAALRLDKRDIFIPLKNSEDFPATMMWFSNGGRDYPPCNGCYCGVLGLEESRTYKGQRHQASIVKSAWRLDGIATVIKLDRYGEAKVYDIIGGITLTDQWPKITTIIAEPLRLTISDRNGRPLLVSFDDKFLRMVN